MSAVVSPYSGSTICPSTVSMALNTASPMPKPTSSLRNSPFETSERKCWWIVDVAESRIDDGESSSIRRVWIRMAADLLGGVGGSLRNHPMAQRADTDARMA